MIAGGSVFVDTNVLLYSISATEPLKQPFAQQWMDLIWREDKGRISWQVIHEFYSRAVRKLGVTPPVARSVVNRLLAWSPEPTTQATVIRAWHWCDAAQVNYWDALILAAAESAGCQWLLTENFQNGQKFGVVTIVNPFLSAPAELGLA